MKTLLATAHGRVQGVGYRYFVVEQARALDLRGWVRNTPEGDVELEAQGADVDLERLIGLVRQGPSLAHVTSLDVSWMDRPDYDGFDIRF